jgi:hypothetical protein
VHAQQAVRVWQPPAHFGTGIGRSPTDWRSQTAGGHAPPPAWPRSPSRAPLRAPPALVRERREGHPWRPSAPPPPAVQSARTARTALLGPAVPSRPVPSRPVPSRSYANARCAHSPPDMPRRTERIARSRCGEQAVSADADGQRRRWCVQRKRRARLRELSLARTAPSLCLQADARMVRGTPPYRAGWRVAPSAHRRAVVWLMGACARAQRARRHRRWAHV